MTSSSRSGPSPAEVPLVSSGLPGLDELLHGGLLQGRVYQGRGRPGAGKTTFGWPFLRAPDQTAHGDTTSTYEEDGPALLITFDEPAKQENADLLLPPDIGRGQIAEAITETVEKEAASRIVVDTMTHFRYLSPIRPRNATRSSPSSAT